MENISLLELLKILESLYKRDKIAFDNNLKFYNMRKRDLAQDQKTLTTQYYKLCNDRERLECISELLLRICNYKYFEIMQEIDRLTKEDAKIQGRSRENWTAQINSSNKEVEVRMSFNS